MTNKEVMKMNRLTPEFFAKLAHLFYAIAMTDGKMVLEEKRKIKEQVELDWAGKNMQSDSAEIIYRTMRTLIKNNMDGELAFEIFQTFFTQNRDLFTDDIRIKIMKSSDRIAMAYAKRNKSELIQLAKLHILLNRDRYKPS